MNSKVRILCVVGVWLTILAVIVGVYRYLIKPAAIEKDRKEVVEKTSTPSRYEHRISFAIDAFSGYAPFRSEIFKEEAARYGIQVDLKDDGANYTQRLKDLADGKVDMGVFTVDALIKCCSEIKDVPATIVCIVDESKGADAMVAAGKQFPNIDALNDPDVRIVCVGNSPSETLARVIMSRFSLERMARNPFLHRDSAELVYKEYQQSKPDEKKVFVLWEPYVSKVVDNPDYRVLMDSSKFSGYIMDVLVVRRAYLAKNEKQVEGVVKSYLSTIFRSRNDMTKLVVDDSVALGEPLKKEQAEKLCNRIWWKNTQEGFAHFGLSSSTGVPHIEDICQNIAGVLAKTGAIPSVAKQTFHYRGIMQGLHDINWHPGFADETVRGSKGLAVLTEEEWKHLKPVGTLHVPKLVFARGTSRLTEASEQTLVELASNLKSFPNFYLTVRGNAASDGDLAANLKLATDRASATVAWLMENGVDRNRIRAESATPNGSTTVVFILGESPY